jgi:putative intracellular protease/amidase
MNVDPELARALRLTGRIATGTALTVVTLASILIAGSVQSMNEAAAQPAELPASRPSAAATEGRSVVAVVLGRTGTDAADALAPYDVFARSDRFSVYTIADSTAPRHLNGGLIVHPTFTFADVASGKAAKPDVVVIPAIDDPDEPSEADLRRWVSSEADAGTRILGICAGARVLAAAGVLDGHRATSHWSRIPELERSRPQVHWVSKQRYVDDGTITTTAGVTSGIPGALHVIQLIAGTAEAERVGQQVDYPGWSVTGPTAIPAQQFTLSDIPLGLNMVVPWFKPTLGLTLTNGTSEIDAVAPIEVYSYASAARVVPIATSTSVTTAHGLVLATTPEASASVDRTVDAQGFQAAFTDLAASTDETQARSTAKMIEYPLPAARIAHGIPDLRVAALLTIAVSLAAFAGLMPTFIKAVRRRRATRVEG